MATTAAPTARDRARAELTEEIKAIARRHLAEHGASGLSLRAVAREVGMVSSAVYRYFPSRDELLTALIIDAYDAVGAAAEAAAASKRRRDIVGALGGDQRPACAPGRSPILTSTRSSTAAPCPVTRLPATPSTRRARVSGVVLRLLVDGVASGEIVARDATTVPRTVRADFAQLRAIAAPGVPDAVLSRALLAWSQLFGGISLEMFGHLHNVIHDYDAFFGLQMRRAAEFLVAAD